jgi:hypothetical protein
MSLSQCIISSSLSLSLSYCHSFSLTSFSLSLPYSIIFSHNFFLNGRKTKREVKGGREREKERNKERAIRNTEIEEKER